jgi:alkylation response protein AidB-like acyl-CoA dehydrogenase
MFHERMLYTSPYVTHPVGSTPSRMYSGTVYNIAREAGRTDDPSVRDLVGEARMLELVSEEMSARVAERMTRGQLSDQAAALVRLGKAQAQTRICTLALEVADSAGTAWTDDSAASHSAVNFLMRQGGSIGGGTVEMARNVVAERVLSMPRERAMDRDIPFRDVPRSRPSH